MSTGKKKRSIPSSWPKSMVSTKLNSNITPRISGATLLRLPVSRFLAAEPLIVAHVVVHTVN